MGDPETKFKRSQQRKKNIYAKVLQENMYHQRIVDPKKEYKRIKINPREVDINESEEDEHETARKDTH